MIRIYGARDSIEAEFVKNLLTTEGIESVVQGEALDAARGDIPYTQAALPSIWIHESDAIAAQAIIDEMKRGGPAHTNPQPNWKCPTCGETLEGQFTTCWKCGYERTVAETST